MKGAGGIVRERASKKREWRGTGKGRELPGGVGGKGKEVLDGKGKFVKIWCRGRWRRKGESCWGIDSEKESGRRKMKIGYTSTFFFYSYTLSYISHSIYLSIYHLTIYLPFSSSQRPIPFPLSSPPLPLSSATLVFSFRLNFAVRNLDKIASLPLT